MCLITIAKIFRCGHLESVFSVPDHCDYAITNRLRHCNRTCHPPTLQPEYSTKLCMLCETNISPSPITSSSSSLDWEGPHLEFFRQHLPLMELLDNSNLWPLFGAQWEQPLTEATRATERLEFELLEQLFPGSSTNERRREPMRDFLDFARCTQVDMEILLLFPCSGGVYCRDAGSYRLRMHAAGRDSGSWMPAGSNTDARDFPLRHNSPLTMSRFLDLHEGRLWGSVTWRGQWQRQQQRQQQQQLPSPPSTVLSNSPAPSPPPTTTSTAGADMSPITNLNALLYASPRPYNEALLTERWLSIARAFPGSEAAGVDHVERIAAEQRIAGEGDLGLCRLIEEAGVDDEWLNQWGLWPPED